MAGESNSSVSSKLLDAIKKDDIKTWKSLVSANPRIFDVPVWSENPLVLAWKLRRFHFISEIGNIKPELLYEKIQDGKNILHAACIDGDAQMVRALVGLRFDQLYFEKDHEFSMIPLQMAVVHGRVAVIRLLLAACSHSIEEVTHDKKTVFHLPAERDLPGTFRVLLEKAKELDKEYLLDKKDCQENTVLHIAVPKKQLQIVKMCLPVRGSTTGYGFASRVNAKNSEGQTAMDLYHNIPDPDFETACIGRILQLASPPEQTRVHPRIETRTTPSGRNLETTNVLLVVLAIFIGLSFTVTCALPTFFPKGYLAVEVFELRDVIYGQLPLIFYIICFITVLLTTSTSILSKLLYSLPCGSLMLLGGFATFILYLLLAHYVMPTFSVKAGSHNVPSFYFMLILVLGFIVIGAIMIHLGSRLMLYFNNLAKSLMRKVVSQFRSSCNEMLPLHNSFEVQMSQVGAAI